MHFFRFRLVAALLLGISLISVASTYFDVLAHKHTMRSELARRTQWFGAGLTPQIEQELLKGDKLDWDGLLSRLRQRPDEPGLAAVDNQGRLLASTSDTPPSSRLPAALIKQSMTAGKEVGGFFRIKDGQEGSSTQDSSSGSSVRLWYEEAIPLHVGERLAGVLLITADADSIRTDAMAVWNRSFLRIAAMVVLVVVVTLLAFRWFLQQPVTRAAEWLRRLGHGEVTVEDGSKEFGYLAPLAKEVSSLAENLSQARAAAETEARLRDQAENIWTADRLAVHVRNKLGNGKLFVVSNREPYIHMRRKGRTECVVPPSGLVTAIEPILQACDGTWIAHGSGNDDSSFVDSRDRLRVPPETKKYTLRRVWLTPEEEIGHYEGFSNEGLWPLCHIAHTRPLFRVNDWRHYQRVNEKFAEVLLEEIRGAKHPAIFVQDYHFALLPRMIKNARPDARVAIFWHIPWPNPEAFSICPWQTELVSGLLGADVIGFHLQSHCNNFLDTVDRALEARTDWEHFSIQRNGHVSSVRSYPIGVAWEEMDTSAAGTSDVGTSAAAEDEKAAAANRKVVELQPGEVSPRKEPGLTVVEKDSVAALERLQGELGIEGKLLLGVDRMDYTKGIVERLVAIEHLLEESPWYREQFTFVQIASPSRTAIPSYRDLRIQVEETVERINRKFQSANWKPVVLIQRQLNHEEVARFYRAAHLCLVTSLHDGMNLVAKEYVAARSDGDGVLVLSRFAGAAQELKDALLVNPYDVVQVSEAIVTGLTMSREERGLRMKRMRHQVKEYNVYRWASNILTDLCAEQIEDDMLAVAMNRTHAKRA